MSDQIEPLTEEERAALESGMCRGGMKALRIIDRDAADRARLVAQVAELEREIERSECATLRQRLEVAERNEAWLRKDRDTQVGNARADRAAAESELAAANALLGRIPDCLLTDCPAHADLVAYKRAHLSSQPAAPDYQAAIDQEHRLACEWKAAAEQYRLEAETTKDALHALRTRVDRAVEHFALAYGSSPYHWPEAVRSALEVLRRSQQ